jgi:hypothetical protein
MMLLVLRLGKVSLKCEDGILALGDVPLKVVHRIIDGGEGLVVVEIRAFAEPLARHIGIFTIHAAANLEAGVILVEDEMRISRSVAVAEVKVNVAALVDAHGHEVAALDDILGDSVQFSDGELASHGILDFSD